MSELTLAAPNACRWCDVEESNHYQRWTQEAAWHMFTSPPDELRLERMRVRREKQARRQGERIMSSSPEVGSLLPPDGQPFGWVPDWERLGPERPLPIAEAKAQPEKPEPNVCKRCGDEDQ